MITVKISKLTLADPAKLRAVQRPLALAKVMAEAVQQRVMVRGQPATTAKPYATHTTHPDTRRITSRNSAGGKTKRGYVVSTQYATAAGVSTNRYDSSADFHRATGTKPGTYRVTGKMWQGLQVRNFGNGAVIEFAGVSLGGSSKPRVAWQRVDGKSAPRRNRKGDVVVLKPKNVRNWEKAGIVFRQSRVNVIQPTDYETRDLVDGVGAKLFDAIRIVTTDGLSSGDTVLPKTALARKFFEALER